MKKRLFVCLTAALVLAWTGIGVAQQGKIPAEVWQKAQMNGVIRIAVELAVAAMPEGSCVDPTGAGCQQAVLAQRQAIAAAQDRLLASLAGTKHRVTGRPRLIPFIGLEAGLDALAVLERSPLVKQVQAEGPPVPPAGPLSP